MADSSTGGYLLPAQPLPPANDADLDALLQAMVSGITGLPGQYVRPRWQPVPPRQPEPLIDWCAIGVQAYRREGTPHQQHNAEGTDTQRRHEQLDVLASFYGPNAARYAEVLADGVYVAQNGDTLRANGLAFLSAGDPLPVPELVNQQWIRRVDLSLSLRRAIARTYQVRNIDSSDTKVHTERTTVDIQVSP